MRMFSTTMAPGPSGAASSAHPSRSRLVCSTVTETVMDTKRSKYIYDDEYGISRHAAATSAAGSSGPTAWDIYESLQNQSCQDNDWLSRLPDWGSALLCGWHLAAGADGNDKACAAGVWAVLSRPGSLPGLQCHTGSQSADLSLRAGV